jgi:hypothetical protein
MTRQLDPTTVRTIANVALVSAGLAAAYVIVTTPSLRRLALTATRWWLGASVPMYLATRAGRAWLEASRRDRAPDIMAG